MTVISLMMMTSKITLSTTAIATRYSTRYSDFLLLLDSYSTQSKKPLIAGAWPPVPTVPSVTSVPTWITQSYLRMDWIVRLSYTTLTLRASLQSDANNHSSDERRHHCWQMNLTQNMEGLDVLEPFTTSFDLHCEASIVLLQELEILFFLDKSSILFTAHCC